MTNSSNLGGKPPGNSSRFWLLLLSRPVIGLLLGLLVVLLWGSWRLWIFVQIELAPLIEKNLSQTLNRPVKLGRVERFSLISLRFGRSSVPAITKQGNQHKDPDRLSVQAVDVVFNPVDLLLNRTLNLDVTLDQPDLYLEQAADGRWISTSFSPREEKGLIETKLQAIRFRKAKVLLIPQAGPRRAFENLKGNVTFVDQLQRLQFDLDAQVVAGGQVQVQGEWSQARIVLTAQAQNLAATELTGLIPLPLSIQAGQVNGNVKVQSRPNQQPSIEGKVRIQAATVVVPDQYLLRSSRPTPRILKGMSGTVQLLDRSARIRFNLKGQVVAGGNLSVEGEWRRPTQQSNLIVRAQNLSAKVLDGMFMLPIAVSSGRVDGNLSIQLRPNQRPSLEGAARLSAVNARLANLPLPFTQVAGQLRFRGLTTTLENLSTDYGKIPLQVSGDVDPDRGYALSGQTAQIQIARVLDTLNVELPFTTAGQVQGQALQVTGPLAQPLLSGQITTLQAAQIDRVNFRQLTGQFRLQAPLLTVTQIRGVPLVGGVVTGDAQINVQTREQLLNLQARGVPGDAIARTYGAAAAITVGTVSAQAQISGLPSNLTTTVQLQTPEATYPGTGQVIVTPTGTRLQNFNLQVAGGSVKVDAQIADNQLQATVQGTEVQLQRFDPTLRGRFSGRLSVAGPLAFQPAAFRAQGQVRFSQGLSLVQQPLTAQVRWDGQKILVDQATATGFSASGVVEAQLQGAQAPRISAFDLDVQAQDYPLQTLPALGDPRQKLGGLADFRGRLTGSPRAPSLQGALRTHNLAVNQLAFESTLTGQLSYGGRGLDLQLAGRRDRIDLALAANLRPTAFYLQRDQAIAVGKAQGERLRINLQRFPLTALNLTPVAGIGPVAGLASGNFDLNLPTLALQGDLAIAQPSLGSWSAEQFVGQVGFAQGVATLRDGELRQANSLYAISGTYTLGDNPQFRAQIKAQAEVQDILVALKWFNLEDVRRGLQPPTYAKAADVRPVGVGTPGAPLETQLRRLSEIEVLLEQQTARRQAASNLPDLAALQGSFKGEIEVSGSRRSGVALDFDLQGKDFDWGPYQVDQLVAKGRFDNGVLNLEPLRLQSQEALVTFSGQVGGVQSGQLRVENVSAGKLRDFIDLPVNVAGELDATATIAGSLRNPQLQGDLRLQQATLNGMPVKTAEGNFRYSNARLDFGSIVVVSGPEPIRLTGSIPYQLPFASVPPAGRQISLDVNLQNEELALLNLFTRQVAWVDGLGRVNLQVRGTLDRPLVNGSVSIAKATLSAQALPEPLTGVTGTVRFNRDRIRVERLTGQYSAGQVTATGVIPIFADLPPADSDQATPLTLSLNQLALKLKSLYTGGVNGNVIVTGTALRPEVGGTIQLADGQVLLTTAPGSAPAITETGGGAETSSLQLNNLRVSLGDRIQVTRPPVLNFLASGDLTVNGTIDNPRPQGIIRFQRGQVNLFTTRFRVERGQPNYAQFKPEQGLDPDLNVDLVTTVTEIIGSRVNSLEGSENVAASSLGALESVRIRARVNGRASQLTNNFENIVELTSSPARNRNEIVALIGGGIGDRLAEENPTLALANLAGSAFFSNFQGLFDDVLNRRLDFRLFPTLTPNETGNSTLDLGAEVGYDVTSKASVSVLQVLSNPGEPTQLSGRYQLNDKVNLRTSVNFEGDTRTLVEYRTRF